MSSPRSSVFRESDYHSPPSRRKRLLERKSTACMCTCSGISFVVLVMFGVTIGLRVTGSRDMYRYQQILGDTTLVQFDPTYCDGVELGSSDAPANLYLLSEKPPLSGWSNISLDASFVLTDYNEYIDNYGWYDYGEYSINIDYITWSFSLNKGSLIYMNSCLDDTLREQATFVLIKGSNTYDDWRNDLTADKEISYDLPSCSYYGDTPPIHYKVSSSDEYFFIFLSSSIHESPRVNLTMSLHRTEYIISPNISESSQCTNVDGPDCRVNVPYRAKTKYSVIQTTNQETKKVKYGDSVSLTWRCLSRSWVYVLIFVCPVIFFTSLFISMYYVIAYFWNRKLSSYYRLGNQSSNDTITPFKIVYGDQEKSAINGNDNNKY